MLPCKPLDKAPHGWLVPHGLKDASSDPDVVRRWWRKVPAANIGLIAGLAFDVLDIDGDAGVAALCEAIPAGAPTINGPTATSGRGRHVYLAPTGLGNRVAVVPHVDFRGIGGYIIAPPSIHPSGAIYSWDRGTEDGPGEPFPPAPPWLVRLLESPMELTRRVFFWLY